MTNTLGFALLAPTWVLSFCFYFSPSRLGVWCNGVCQAFHQSISHLTWVKKKVLDNQPLRHYLLTCLLTFSLSLFLSSFLLFASMYHEVIMYISSSSSSSIGFWFPNHVWWFEDFSTGSKKDLGHQGYVIPVCHFVKCLVSEILGAIRWVSALMNYIYFFSCFFFILLLLLLITRICSLPFLLLHSDANTLQCKMIVKIRSQSEPTCTRTH